MDDLFGYIPPKRTRRAAETEPKAFFKDAQAHSVIKADIVSKYAVTWAKIIVNHRINNNQTAKVYVLDLFSGCGIYEDGTKSTPIRMVEQMIDYPNLLKHVAIRFNDESPLMVERLQANIQNVPGNRAFAHEIEYTCQKAASPEVMNWLEANAKSPSPVPMLVFIDPFGYKEISRELLRLIINTPQSDIIMFFNYRRINAALGNEQFKSNMNKIFGDVRVQNIKQELNAKHVNREAVVIRHLTESLGEIGAKYIVPYVVVPENQEHSSHYIIGITKHEKGYIELKKRLRIDSQISENAQASFGFNPASLERDKQPKQQHIFDGSSPKLGRIELLANKLHEEFKGQVKIFEVLYNSHQRTTDYTEPEYKQAIRLLLSSSRASCSDIDEDYIRKNPKSEMPIGNRYKIRFA